jgi:ABC-type Fe3+-hydroxamate transport system substrate-binding protein
MPAVVQLISIGAVLLAASAISHAQTPDLAAANMRIGGTAYPRAAMDFQGTTVKLAGPPKRIVALSDQIAEYLYQFLPGERIVGIDKAAFEEFSSVQDAVNKYHPRVVKDAKSILVLKPDLVLTSDSMCVNATAELQAANVPIFSI